MLCSNMYQNNLISRQQSSVGTNSSFHKECRSSKLINSLSNNNNDHNQNHQNPKLRLGSDSNYFLKKLRKIKFRTKKKYWNFPMSHLDITFNNRKIFSNNVMPNSLKRLTMR